MTGNDPSSGEYPTGRYLFVLLGGFALAYNIAIACHELGHGLAYLLAGERMTDFVLNPFSWSWSTGERFNLFVLWGEVTFGQLFALLPLLLSLKIRNPLVAYLGKLLAACAFLINGIYLSMGTVFGFGDGGSLTSLGVNRIFVLVPGGLYILVSFFFWSSLQKHLGLGRQTGFFQRIRLICGGIWPYMILIFLYNRIHNPGQMAMWGGLAAAGMIAAVLIALAGHLQSRPGWKASFPDPLPPGHATGLVIAALLMILGEFFVFGTPANPF